MSTEHADIDRRFTVAVSWIQNKNVQFPFKPTPKQSLFFYGRYKQATSGDNTASKPSMFTPIRRYMWSAHEKNKGKSSGQAKSEYVAEIDKLIAEFDLTALPANLENDAHAFFSQFYGTAQHPHVQHLPNKRHLLDEEKKQHTIEEGDEDAARSMPNSPEQPASLAATSGVNHKVRSPPELGNSDALFTSIPSSSTSSSSSSAVSSPLKATSASASSSPAAAIPDSSASSSSSSMTSPPRPSAQLLSEVSDKELLAQRLIELQIANQQKMAQLERQMALMAARQGTPAKSDYTTPAKVGGIRSALQQSPGLVGAAGAPLHSVLEPSSPFASSWTPSGLSAVRPPLSASQPSARQQLFSPSTPFQTYHTPYTHHATSHLNGSSAPIRNLQAEIASIATTNPAVSSVSTSSITVYATSSSQRPSRATSPSRTSVPDSSAPAVTASSSSSSSSSSPANAALSSQDLDSLLGALDAKHRAQVAEFQSAEREWVERLAAAEARADQLQARVAAAEHGHADSALSVSVNIEKKSFLHSLVSSTATTVKIAVPIGVAAWTTFKLWREYERRVLKR